MTGGCGCCTGFGQAMIGAKSTNSPWYSGVVLGPDRLHRLDPLARQLVAGGEGGAVVLDLVRVPAIADAEQEAAAGDPVDRGHQLGGLDRVALHHQADAGAELAACVVAAAAAVRVTNGSITS